MFQYHVPVNSQPRAPYVKLPTFRQTRIHASALSKLLADFSAIHFLDLDQCNFAGMDEAGLLNTSMSDTAMSTIKITTEKVYGKMILLSVCSTGNNISKYYLNAAKGDPTTEITKATFEKLTKGIKSRKRIRVITLAKAIKHVFFHAGTFRDITASL